MFARFYQIKLTPILTTKKKRKKITTHTAHTVDGRARCVQNYWSTPTSPRYGDRCVMIAHTTSHTRVCGLNAIRSALAHAQLFGHAALKRRDARKSQTKRVERVWANLVRKLTSWRIRHPPRPKSWSLYRANAKEVMTNFGRIYPKLYYPISTCLD